MTEKEFLELYSNETINIEGYNQDKLEGLYFKHFYEHFGDDLAGEILCLKEFKKINKKYKGLLNYEEKTQKNKETQDVLQKIRAGLESGEIKLSEKQLALLKYAEKIYFDGLESNVKITPLRVEDGRVQILDSQVYHRCRIKSMQGFQSYANLGIIPTEWLGMLESAGEARFCAFVQTSENNAEQGKGADLPNYVKFYIDEESELWKKLAEFDFFEYEHIKKTAPERLTELYPQEIIDLYDEIIKPLSPNGDYLHDNPTEASATWKAIPGGIPPQLIVGVQISSKNSEFQSHIAEIKKMFPNAVIFDENHRVLSHEAESE